MWKGEDIATLIDMDKRLADMPVMAQRPDHIEAPYYNIWRRYRARWGSPVRLDLPGLKEMKFVLCDSYWVVVDSVKYDVPVIAWVELEDAGRNALHQPVACKLNHYHFAASAVRARALAGMEEVLAKRLRKDNP